LCRLFGWFAKPSDDIIAGAVNEFLKAEYPLFGTATQALTEALINACAQRHYINKAAASENMKVGAAVSLLLLALMAEASQTE
jgi:predicted lipoprotein